MCLIKLEYFFSGTYVPVGTEASVCMYVHRDKCTYVYANVYIYTIFLLIKESRIQVRKIVQFTLEPNRGKPMPKPDGLETCRSQGLQLEN